jgi:hypothetical protein
MASFQPGDPIKVRVGFAGVWFEGRAVHVTDRYVDVITETGRRFAVKATSGSIRLLSEQELTLDFPLSHEKAAGTDRRPS